MPERAVNIAEFTAIEDHNNILRHGGIVGKHDTYPPLL
jgi:hypothetical protein